MYSHLGWIFGAVPHHRTSMICMICSTVHGGASTQALDSRALESDVMKIDQSGSRQAKQPTRRVLYVALDLAGSMFRQGSKTNSYSEPTGIKV